MPKEKKRGENALKNTRIIIFFLTFLLILPMAGHAFASEEETVEIPQLTIARQTIPENEAMRFLRGLGVGWNLGNTFDAYKGDWNKNADEMTVEKTWCGVYTTREMIHAVREAGYGVIRIPVSWHDHVTVNDQGGYTISERWLGRVQEVVDWALDEGLYVILNTHHDDDIIYPSKEKLDQAEKYIGSVWAQLAARFRDYDEHLIFEAMNEPRLKGTAYEWNFDQNAQPCMEAAQCLNQLAQLFVDTVRAAGGGNETRYLMVPGYCASPYSTLSSAFVLPKDTAENRIIVSVHAYTPYSFALQLEGGVRAFSLKNPAQTQDIAYFMDQLYKKFIKQGIPVIIGEFGALDKNGNLQDRVDFTAFYTAMASARNIPAVWWDNNVRTGNGERFCLLNRAQVSWAYPQIVQAMMQYGGYDALPEKK